MRVLTFNELRAIKDSLPDGTMHQIADEFNMDVETVRNYFGAQNHEDGFSAGLHTEPGPDGGLVYINNTTVLDRALEILKESREEQGLL